jgi:hypothetical protein
VPALRDHLHAPLADRPSERPDTRELPRWVATLADLVRHARLEDVGVEWREPEASETGRVVGRARPAVTGTETDAYQRIERLERELVALRATMHPAAPPISAPPVPAASSSPAGPSVPQFTMPPTAPAVPMAMPPTAAAVPMAMAPPAAAQTRMATQVADGPAPSSEVFSGPPAAGATGPVQMRGRARVVPRPAPEPTGMMEQVEPEPERYRPPRGDRARTLKIGWELTGTGAFIAFICWGLWAVDSEGSLTGPALAFVLVLAVAGGVFALTRLLGRLILEQRLGRVRRTAKGAHALTALFLAGAGLAYLRQVDWVMAAVHWLGNSLW